MTIKKKTYSGIFRDAGAGAQAKRRYRDRRKKLMQRENKLMAITGVPYGPGGETVWAYAHCPTYQEPAMMHFTGVNQTNVILLLDPHSKESDEILFVGKKDLTMEFWEGVRFGVGDPKSVKEAQSVTGIKDIRDVRDFEAVLKERLFRQKKKELGLLWMEGTKKGRKTSIQSDHNWEFKKMVNRCIKSSKAPQTKMVNIMENHFDLRLPLDKYDVANTDKAQEITAEAFKETLRKFHNFNNESQIAGFLEGQMLMGSPYGLSFPSIIASGKNATVLHYMKNDDDFSKDEMVLMDFGVRWMTMHADISRTVPANGRFNHMQKLLYEIVLRAQWAVEQKAAPGVTIEQLNDVCWESVNHDLEHMFRKLGGKFKLKYNKRPHGVSHLMGEQEHDGDPFRNYTTQPMKPGWMISNEPGLYGKFKIKLYGGDYDAELGIRIEDNLLITDMGCINLSRCVPKTVTEIHRLMKNMKEDDD